MKTYLKVLFHSEGAKPSLVEGALAGLGFKPTAGHHDFVYDWPQSASVRTILDFGDRIHSELNGMHVMFEMETL